MMAKSDEIQSTHDVMGCINPLCWCQPKRKATESKPPATILDRAAAIVAGPREATYGHPRENFARIARLWSAILNTPVSAREVGLCMIALKLAREASGKQSDDNLVDIAGYARCIERLDESK